MTTMRSVEIGGLRRELGGRSRFLIGRVSFEERSLVVPVSLSNNLGQRGIIFVSSDAGELARQNETKLRGLLPNAKVVALNICKPLDVAMNMHRELCSVLSDEQGKDLIVDVTSFRREELLMLLAILRLDKFANISGDITYVGAGVMASDWMTRNYVQHRSVIGYAGVIKPSRPTCLIMLMGFEVERARSIIENYEPAKVIVGRGSQSESINQGLFDRNARLVDELRKSFGVFAGDFDFSPRDPNLVVEQLANIISDVDQDHNIIIAPLHTKLSTLGVGLYAQRHQGVQVCYAVAAEYNVAAYSTVGSCAYMLDLKMLLK